MFNSRATQLVLGAGAIHSTAKLKSISAKHLALCSQSLGLVRAVIPLLKAALATRLPQKHHLLLAQMDAVAQVCGFVSWQFVLVGVLRIWGLFGLAGHLTLTFSPNKPACLEHEPTARMQWGGCYDR